MYFSQSFTIIFRSEICINIKHMVAVQQMRAYQKTEENPFGQKIGLPVQFEVKPEAGPQALNGETVQLLPFSEMVLNDDRINQLWLCSNQEADDRCWTYLPYDACSDVQALRKRLLGQFGFAQSQHFVIEHQQQAKGWIALLNIRPEQGVIEIGNVYFSEAMKQSTAATESIYLLLKNCFEQGYRRVEWKCDELNLPSRRAALRLGFQYEGIFRQDRVVKGRNRNTAWFSMLDEEWSELSKAYQAWLNSENFDAAGQQKIRLGDFIVLYQEE